MSALIRGVKYRKEIWYLHMLIQNGADVNAKDYENHTVLMIASGIELKSNANLNAMKLLIENGANVNAVEEKYHCTPLMAASGFRNRANLHAMILLIENGANVNAVDIYGYTSLMFSTGIRRPDMENIEAFKLLLEHGADINIQGRNGLTVCNFLCAYNQPNLHIFQSVINCHYRKEMLTYMAAIKNDATVTKNDATVTKIEKFLQISNGPRKDWEMHINSFLSLSIKPN